VRLFGGNLAWFVFWGYQLFIVLAATGYLLGATQSKEYAEPEWYVDIWLTLVWVSYLVVFLGTIIKRKERHIYVANWFFLSFIVTVAMLHVVNNLAIPVSIWSSKSVQLFAGVQDAMTQWWYGHNAVGFFLTAGVALHGLDNRTRAFRRAWLERDDHLCGDLLSDAQALGPQGDAFCRRDELALLARDDWHRALRRINVGHRHYGRLDVARGR